jgi:ribosomal protein S18 acetylase RimI-like enzyme
MSTFGQPMTIRAIEPRDIPELFELRASTRENPYSREALREIGITEERTVAMLRGDHCGWLCEVAGMIVGFAMGDGSTGEIGVVAVLPKFENQGIGSRLLTAVEMWLCSLGWAELWLWTSADRKKSAFAFYTARGWRVSEDKGEVVHMRKNMPNQSPDPTLSSDMSPAGQEARRR